MISTRNKTQKLSRQLIAAILALYFGVALTFTLFQLLSEFHNEKNRLTEQIASIFETFQPTINEALWNYEEEQLRAAMAGLYRNPEIFGIHIISIDQEQWNLGYVQETTNSKENKTNKVTEHFDDSLYSFSKKQLDIDKVGTKLYHTRFPILRQVEGSQETIGYQTIYYSSVTIYERLWITFLITISGALIKTLALWLISIFVVSKLVSKPLNELEKRISEFDINSIDSSSTECFYPKSKNQNEIYFLKHSYAKFCDELILRNQNIEENEKKLEATIKKRTEILEKTTEDLQKANAVKSNFLATMSHEIRTPMNAILGCVQILRKSNLLEQDKKLVSTINTSCKNLLTIINDILDFSKIEADKMILEKIPFDLEKTLDDTINVFLPIAKEKNITLDFKKSGHVTDKYIIGDPTRITQIINNFLSNAIKFTDIGSVVLYMDIKKNLPGSVDITLTVQDTGIGMNQEQLQGLFKKFTQADSSTTRNYGGTGLGLAICKHLIENMGGNIHAESAPNIGSKFIAKFTADSATQESVSENIPQQHRTDTIAARILLVDDVEANREIATLILQDYNHTITTASNGINAVEIYREKYADIDLILMDCQMPEMDGFEASKTIRKYELKNQFPITPIIALTASALQETQNQCIEAGMNSFVTKPIEEHKLVDNIQEQLLLTSKQDAPTVLQLDPQEKPISNNDRLDISVLDGIVKRFGNERGTKFIHIALSSINSRIDELEKAVDNQDLETLSRSAHSLKSSFANVGAFRAQALANEVELEHKEHNTSIQNDSIENLLAEAQIAKQRLQQYLGASD